MTNLFHTESTVTDGNLAIQHGEPANVLRRTREFMNSQGLSLSDSVLIVCQHTDQIMHVTGKNKATTIPTEALITNEPDVILFLLTGDCFPVTFHDPEKGVVALAHLGWKPTDKRLVEKVVQEMVWKYGSDPAAIQVHIGSGISADSYVFDVAVQKEKPEWQDFIQDLPNGQVSVDLAAYIKRQLSDSGVLPEYITTSDIDTATSLDRFSYYRSVRTDEPQARFATVAVLQA